MRRRTARVPRWDVRVDDIRPPLLDVTTEELRKDTVVEAFHAIATDLKVEAGIGFLGTRFLQVVGDLVGHVLSDMLREFDGRVRFPVADGLPLFSEDFDAVIAIRTLLRIDA